MGQSDLGERFTKILAATGQYELTRGLAINK